MTISLTGGLSFSGGFTFEAATPELQNTAAWFGGGGISFSTSLSTVDRIIFATDTATASVRGPLSSERTYLAAASNFDYGWFGGGYDRSNGTWFSTVDRITYATDTATASVRGPLSAAVYGVAAAGNTTDGWFGGGLSGAPSYDNLSTVARITYATDTATASVRGPLSLGKRFVTAAGNSTDGWWAGGASPQVSTVNRITFATDTDTASVRGPLDAQIEQMAAASNSTDGWFAGGYPGPVSTVQRITWATDTDTASVRGPLSAGSRTLAAAGNTTDGWFGGGAPSTSTVDRITYATDTATASTRGPLSEARFGLAAAGGIQ